MSLTVEALAKEIRKHPLCDYSFAAALASTLLPFIERHIATPQPPKPAGAVDDVGERVAFEKWLSGFPNPPPLERVGEKQAYSYATTLAGWNAWMQRAVLAAAGMGLAAGRADAVLSAELSRLAAILDHDHDGDEHGVGAKLRQLAQQSASASQQMTTQGEAVAAVIEAARDVAKRAGPDREHKLHAALAVLTGSQP